MVLEISQNMRRPTLPEVFRRYNKKYFGNRLKVSDVKFGKPSYNAHGETSYFDGTDPLITVSRRFLNSGRLVRLILLHEMVHVDGYFSHDARFKRQIRRLIRLGAYDDLL